MNERPPPTRCRSNAPRGRRVSPRRGAALVEFAVVVPLFLLLLFGMIELGRGIMVQQIITNAAREGARLGVLPSTTTAQVNTAVTTYLSGAGVSGATISVSPSPPSSATYGSSVTVTVSIPYSSVSWVPSPSFLKGATLTATSVMRTEQTSGS